MQKTNHFIWWSLMLQLCYFYSRAHLRNAQDNSEQSDSTNWNFTSCISGHGNAQNKDLSWIFRILSENLYSYNFRKNTSRLVEEFCKEFGIWQKAIFMTELLSVASILQCKSKDCYVFIIIIILFLCLWLRKQVSGSLDNEFYCQQSLPILWRRSLQNEILYQPYLTKCV